MPVRVPPHLIRGGQRSSYGDGPSSRRHVPAVEPDRVVRGRLDGGVLCCGMPSGDLERLGIDRDRYRARIGRTLDFLEGHYRQPLTVHDVARSGDWSPRSMQQAFSLQLGTTPFVLLRRLRLQYAHDRLANPYCWDSVATAARSVSISHLGRFSAYYSAQYGELPSETRARSQRVTR